MKYHIREPTYAWPMSVGWAFFIDLAREYGDVVSTEFQRGRLHQANDAPLRSRVGRPIERAMSP